MADLPDAISPTLAAIDEALERTQFASTAWRISPSMLVAPCERSAWYKFRWTHPPERFPGLKLRLFEGGRTAEGQMLGWLASVEGVLVVDIDPETGRQIEASALDGHFRAKVDAIATGIKEAPKAEHIVECKEMNAAAWRQLKKHGVAEAKPDHVAQMQLYMHLVGPQRAFYMAKNRDTEELHAERVRYDPAQAAALMAKGERLLRSDAPPPRINDDPDSRFCQSCPAVWLCHMGDQPPRNCRTCLHSKPGAIGPNWWCERHQIDMDPKQQARGCPHHLYLPSLVPGEQIDADPATETVTYRMPSGQEWVDGADREERTKAAPEPPATAEPPPESYAAEIDDEIPY